MRPPRQVVYDEPGLSSNFTRDGDVKFERF